MAALMQTYFLLRFPPLLSVIFSYALIQRQGEMMRILLIYYGL